MSTIETGSPSGDAVGALPPVRSDVADQLERLRQVADQLSQVTHPGAPAFLPPTADDEPTAAAEVAASHRRRLHLRRRSA